MENFIKKWFRVEAPSKKITNEHFTVKNSDTSTLDQLKFIFSQSEKRLEDSHKTFDATTNKTITLITLTVAIFSTLTTYFFLQNDINGVFNEKLFTVLLLSLYSFFILLLLIRNILPYSYQPSGTKPNELLNINFYSYLGENKDDVILKDMYYSELVNYDFRITHNFSINEPRLERIRVSIQLLAIFPFIGLIIYLITAFLV